MGRCSLLARLVRSSAPLRGVLLVAMLALSSTFLSTADAGAAEGDSIVAGWGRDSSGQLAIPAGIGTPIAVAAGDEHSLALRADGTVVAWGLNNAGQASVPAGLADVTAIAAGAGHSLALKADGTVVAWGSNLWGQSSVPAGLSDVVAIAAGKYHSLAVKADGTVVGWGDDSYGQLPPPGLTGVTAISGGEANSLALLNDGTMVGWGFAGFSLVGSDFVAIAQGDFHNLALKSDGTVVAWMGTNDSGQISVPAGLSDVIAIDAGGDHSVALKSDGTVVAWGLNDHGQATVPTGTAGITAISAGGRHTLVVGENNQAPSEIKLSSANIEENLPAGTVVGNLSTMDTVGTPHTLALVAGPGGEDNASFTLQDGVITTNASLDHEVRDTYSIRVRATDVAGLSLEKTFSIDVINVNEAPTSITLTPASLLEEQPAGTTVGFLSTEDPDVDEAFTYELLSNTSPFTLVGNEVRTTEVLDYAITPKSGILVRVRDAGGLMIDTGGSFPGVVLIPITILPAAAPTDIALSETSVAEEQPADTVIGTLSTIDSDSDEFTYELVPGGGLDDLSFSLAGDVLKTAAIFDFETKSSYTIRVRSTDASGLFFEKDFTIAVTDVVENTAPADLTLSATSVPESQSAGTQVGTLSANDAEGGPITYTLVSGPGGEDNTAFSITGDVLSTAASFDFETKSTYSIRVRATDSGGLYVDGQFTVTVTDALEMPSTKDECKKNGWKRYGVFKNQGACISYVATGGANLPTQAKPQDGGRPDATDRGKKN